MGLLIDGVWHDREREPDAGGRFVRTDTDFRNWVTPDGRPGPTGHDGFSATAGALSSLRLACLPLGTSHADHACAERP